MTAWRVSVPASAANLGPGFDILALALDLRNEVVVESRNDGAIIVERHGNPPPLADADNLVLRGYREDREVLSKRDSSTGVMLRSHECIPISRGLGSSAAALVAGLAAAQALHRRGELDPNAILAQATRLEGHPDNIAACVLGGLVICAPGAAVKRLAAPDDLRCVLLVPDSTSRTAEARQVVPRTFSREDAVFNAGRCAQIVHGFVTGDYSGLKAAMEDHWHQPFRAALFPALEPVLAAAYDAGALGACLAGAGPSMLAFTRPGNEDRVGHAMLEAARRVDPEGMQVARVLTLSPDNLGLTVESAA